MDRLRDSGPAQFGVWFDRSTSEVTSAQQHVEDAEDAGYAEFAGYAEDATEHDLFERYAASAADRAPDGLTVLVSHRLPAVRMADLIVLLGGWSVAGAGSNEDLLRAAGPYRGRYTIRQRVYQ